MSYISENLMIIQQKSKVKLKHIRNYSSCLNYSGEQNYIIRNKFQWTLFCEKLLIIGRTLSVGVHQNGVWPRTREKLNLFPAPDLIFNVFLICQFAGVNFKP